MGVTATLNKFDELWRHPQPELTQIHTFLQHVAREHDSNHKLTMPCGNGASTTPLHSGREYGTGHKSRLIGPIRTYGILWNLDRSSSNGMSEVR